MGTYLFKWTHPASEVYVTGDFDDWGQTIKLDGEGDVHQKLVHLPNIDKKIEYKFVVDGNWTTDHTRLQENDGHNNINNVLLPEEITKLPAPSAQQSAAAALSGVLPGSTTTAMAAQVPLHDQPPSSDLPGSFPETPAAESSEFGVKPLPASSGAGNPISLAPGQPVPPPGDVTSNTVDSTIRLDKESYEKGDALPARASEFGVKPIPASSGAGNPISLAPGQPVPPPGDVTSNTVDSTVRLDKESYEKGDALPAGASEFGVKPIPASSGAGNPISLAPGQPVPPPGDVTSNTVDSTVRLDKESYEKGDALPTGGSTNAPLSAVQSSGPQSTTAALAAKVPLQQQPPTSTTTEVPELVKESQQEAHVDPEASANPTAVLEKAEVEQELEKKVSPEPPATESTVSEKLKGIAAGTAAGATAAVAGATAYFSGNKSSDEVEAAKNKVPEPVKNVVSAINGTPSPAGGSTGGTAVTSFVPDTVWTSIAEAHQPPEAAANKEAVLEKEEVESELLKKVEPEQSAGDPGPSVMTAATSAEAPKPLAKSTETPLSDYPAAMASFAPDTDTEPAKETFAKSTAEPLKGESKTEKAKTKAAEVAGGAVAAASAAGAGAAAALSLNKNEEKAPEPPAKDVPSKTPTTAPSNNTASTATPSKEKKAAAADPPAPATPAKDSKPKVAAVAPPAGQPAAAQDPGRLESRDISPMSRPGETSAAGNNNNAAAGGPTVTTGVSGPSATPSKSTKETASASTPTKAATTATPDATATASPMSTKTQDSLASGSGSKKDGNRRSSGFFRKLKDKFHHHHHHEKN